MWTFTSIISSNIWSWSLWLTTFHLVEEMNQLRELILRELINSRASCYSRMVIPPIFCRSKSSIAPYSPQSPSCFSEFEISWEANDSVAFVHCMTKLLTEWTNCSILLSLTFILWWIVKTRSQEKGWVSWELRVDRNFPLLFILHKNRISKANRGKMINHQHVTPNRGINVIQTHQKLSTFNLGGT